MSNIVLLAPNFYNYWSLIAKGLSAKGYNVHPIIYPSSIIYKLAELFNSMESFSNAIKERFFYSQFRKLINKEVDTIIIIKSSYIPQNCLEYLKRNHPQARFILYLWDDLSIDSKEIDRLSFFDKVLSFSMRDSKLYGILYRPMFYDNSVDYHIDSKKIDLFYIASYKENRFHFLEKIIKIVNENCLNSYFILRCSIFLFLKNPNHYKYHRYFKTKGLNYQEMMSAMCGSKCAIELQHPGQTGLTTRPIEAIATHTKIITTNKNIVDYSLYNKNNIYVIDENDPKLDKEWLSTPYEVLPKEIESYYSLSRFIDDLLAG